MTRGFSELKRYEEAAVADEKYSVQNMTKRHQ